MLYAAGSSKCSGQASSAKRGSAVLVEQARPEPAMVHDIQGRPSQDACGCQAASTSSSEPGSAAGREEDVSWMMTDRLQELAASMDARGAQEHHLIKALQVLSET